MPTHRVTAIVDGQPCFEKPLSEILGELKAGGAIKTLSPLEYHTGRQRRWYKGICLPWLFKHPKVNENRESLVWWDKEVKRKCDGLNLLKMEYECWDDGKISSRLTTKGVGKKKMTAFIEEILAISVEKNWGVTPPDKDLRK